MLHKHHIIPRHAGGDDSPENIVVLSVEEHAEAHLALWMKNGNRLDLIAYRMISGWISPKEASILARREGARRGGLACKGTPKPPRTKEYREKQSIAQTGKTVSLETRRKIGAAHLGNKRSAGVVPWNKGKTVIYSAETIAKLSAAGKAMTGERNNFFGKTHSERSLAKNRAAHLGKPAWNKGKTASAESRARMSASKMGRKASAETRAKMSASQRARYRKVKNAND